MGADNNWATADNWAHFVEGALPTGSLSETALIDNGDTVLVDSSFNAISSPDGPPGEVIVTNGSVFQVVGAAAFTTDASGSEVDGSAAFTGGGVLSMTGPSASFASSSLSFAGGGVYSPLLTGGAHGLISTPGAVELNGGTLRPSLDAGFSPTGFETWNLIDATTINGDFVLDQSLAPAGANFVTSVASGGTNGQLLQLGLQSVLVLTINVDDGSATLSSPSGGATAIIGYSIASAAGELSPDGWFSFQDQANPGWSEAGTPSNNLLDELAGPADATTLGSAAISSTPTGIGSPYPVKSFQETGVNDHSFEYVTSDFQFVEGQVQYTGLNLVNNLLLTVDPSTGEAELKNSSQTTLSLRGYSVLSDSGSLKPLDGDWNSLSDQGETGVQEAAPTAEQLSELIPQASDALVLAPGTTYQLGGVFSTAGAQDLSLEFLLATEAGATGDYNNDGVVDAADYTVWRDNLGADGGTLANRDPGNSGDVSQDDYNSWRANFGATSSGDGGFTILDGVVLYESLPAASIVSARAPEPGAACLMLTLLGGAIAYRRGLRQ